MHILVDPDSGKEANGWPWPQNHEAQNCCDDSWPSINVEQLPTQGEIEREQRQPEASDSTQGKRTKILRGIDRFRSR
jgi:hypothetical protein